MDNITTEELEKISKLIKDNKEKLNKMHAGAEKKFVIEQPIIALPVLEKIAREASYSLETILVELVGGVWFGMIFGTILALPTILALLNDYVNLSVFSFMASSVIAVAFGNCLRKHSETPTLVTGYMLTLSLYAYAPFATMGVGPLAFLS